MSSNEDDLKTSLNIANYFFEVGLLNESLTKQYANQLNEKSTNNRKKLKRLLSNANNDLIAENKEFFQNFKRNDNFSDIIESVNSLAAHNGSVSTVSSISSVYHSDESLDPNRAKNNNEYGDIKFTVPNLKNSNNSIQSTPPRIFGAKKSVTTTNIDTSFMDKMERDLPPIPNNRVSLTSIDETIRNKRASSIVKSKSVSRSTLSSQRSLSKKLSSQSTLDSLNLCINEDDDKKISPEVLESNTVEENDELKAAEIAFNKKFPERPNSKLKSVSSMPLISTNSIKKSSSKAALVHEFDDDAPLAYLKISLSKDNLNLQQKSSSPTINAIHPIENKYSSNILLRYPEKDCNNVKLEDTKFINLFCFPNDISLKYSLKKPYSTYHSFINTNLQGEKSYGVCVIIYEKIKGNVKKSYEQLLNKWIKENIDDNEKEYIIHIHTELEKQQDELEQTKLKLKEILYKNDFVTKEDLAIHDELSKNLNEIGENIKLYEEILNTLGNKRFITAENVYQPKCIGVTSSWPWYSILKDWLSLVVRETVGGFGNRICIPLERYIINILHEIPFPPPGKYEISISTSEKTLYFSQPPKNEIPLINNFSFYPTFRCLSHNNIIAITEMLLGERKMIFVSSYAALLSNVIETFCSLIYPFEWKYVLIPVLPVKLLQYTHAPGPYIIGVLREYIDEMKEDLNEEACIIDIDNDMVEYGRSLDDFTGKEIEFPKIPIKEKKRLLSKLNKYAIAGVKDDIIITKNNMGSGKPLGVPKFMMYTYPNGDFISSSRSKIDNDAVIQKLKAQSCNNSTANSTNSTINRKMGKLIQNEIDINIINSNSDISRYPFDFFSKKRIISDNKNQTITSIPMNNNKNNNNDNETSQSENTGNEENVKAKKKDSLISRSLSAANLLNVNNPGHNRGYSVTTSPMSNSEYILHPNMLKNGNNSIKSNTLPHNIITTANSITTFSENIGAKKRDGHIFKEFIPDASNFITIDTPPVNSGCSYSDLSNNHQNEAKNFVIVPNTNSPTTGKYQDKSFLYKNTCDICEKYLFSSNMKILKCTACSSIIHISCLSKISNFPCISSFNQPKIQSAFVKVFRNIFKNYRKYIIIPQNNTDKSETATINTIPQDNNNQLEWFNTTAFIKESEKSYQEFLTLFKDSQAFAQFTLERAEKPATDHSIQYFDELINYKKKKSKLYPKEVSTFFLNKSDAIKKTVEAHKPNQEDLEYDDIMVKSDCFPESLNERLLCEPRPCDNLLLPEDIQIINDDITNTISSRPDTTISKKKQEYWSWFKIVKDTETQQEDPFSSFKFTTDEERSALLEKIYKRVAEVIRESTPANKDVLSIFTSERIEKKLDTLYNNVELLKRAADEQLIENNDQKQLHINLKSLFELITIYEDHLAKRKQDSMIMKSAVDYDSGSSDEEIKLEIPPPKSPFKKLDNQRVEINSMNSSKSSVSSPTSPITKTPTATNPNPDIIRTNTFDQ